MSATWFIAKRYFQASRRAGFVSFITGFATLGVMIGTAAVIIALTIIGGFEREIKEKVFAFTSHIQIIGFQNQPLTNYRQSVSMMQDRFSEIRTVAPFVMKETMIRFGEKVDGVLLKGIDPHGEVQPARKYLVEGRFLSSDGNEPELVIGRKLMDKLGIRVGEKVVLFGLPYDSGLGSTHQPRAGMFRIVGVFESGMSEYDDIHVFATIEQAQRLLQLGDAVSGFEINVSSIDHSPEIARSVQTLLGYPHHARTARQLYRNLFAWIELQKKPAPLLLGLIIIVAVVNIIGALLMLVLEKIHAVGVLKSLGANGLEIRRIFLIQALIIGLAGVALGNGLAFLLSWIQLTFGLLSLPSDIYFMNTVPILLQIENFIAVTFIVLVLCLLAALLPARAAARLDAVTSLRFN
jgi:lipoprotein-releasing system permease protein